MLTRAEIDAIVSRIVSRTDPERVIVFGSYAKGNATVCSDLDLLVVNQTDQPFMHRTDDIRPLLSTLLVRVDVHVYTPVEVEADAKDPLSFISSVLTTGWTAYQRPAA